MVGYCKTTDCLRGYILDYFGQEHDDTCGSCGNCRGMFALEDMAAKCPRTLEEMGEVSGVGQKKLEQYGEVFLRAIADYEKA